MTAGNFCIVTDIVTFLRPRWTGFLSECIYLNNMHEVKRLKPTKSEIFMKMSLKIFCSASIIARDLFRVARTFCAATTCKTPQGRAF